MWSFGSCPNDLQITDVDLMGQSVLYCLGFHSITSHFVCVLASSAHVVSFHLCRGSSFNLYTPLYSGIPQLLFYCYYLFMQMLRQAL